MKDKFAKLFETEKGQILVKLDDGDEGAEVRFYFMPEGLGVCSMALQFEGSDDHKWDLAESAFEKVDEELALSFVGDKMEKGGMLNIFGLNG